MGTVMQLKPSEDINIDLDRLVEVYEKMGVTGNSDAVVRAVEHIEDQLVSISRLYHAGRFREAGVHADNLSCIAAQIGMDSLVSVATDVTVCAEASDTAGLGATVARLTRIGTQSLDAITDPPMSAG